MEWALMLLMAIKTGAASELLGTYKTMHECQTVAQKLSGDAAWSNGRETYIAGEKTSTSQPRIRMYYSCSPVPKAYIYE